jgi:hypothetical protein
MVRRLAIVVLGFAMSVMGSGPGAPSVAVAASAAPGGHRSAESAIVDDTPPTGGAELYDISARGKWFELELTFADPESGIDHLEVRCDDGPAATYAPATILRIPFFDTAKGGCETYGEHQIWATAVNGAGLVNSDAVHVTLNYVVTLTMAGEPVTGEPITFTPTLPDGFSFPDAAWCTWELRWGNDDAILRNDFNATFGAVMSAGPKSKGFCDAWTLTLPWAPVPHFQVSFHMEDEETEDVAGDKIGFRKDGSDVIRAGVASTDRRITESTMPVMMVLPDAYIATVGEPITYRLYPAGGAQYDDNDSWIAAYEAGEHLFQKQGGRSFTFVPDRVGDWVMIWNAMGKEPYQLSAIYDPPAKRADNTRPTTTTPVTRLDSGAVGSTVPATVSWNGKDTGWGIDHYKLQRSVDGGAWGGTKLLKSTSWSVSLTPGHRYRFRVRAYDKAGNAGAWDEGPTIRVRAVQDTSTALEWSGAWNAVTDDASWGGTSHRSDAAGATARYRFTGRGIAWVAGRDPGRGTARVYLDGTLVATIDLGAASTSSRRVVWRRSWAGSDDHRVRIVVVGDTGTPTVDVDGFVVLR